MARRLLVESLAIGDELLDGRLADTNSKALADALAGFGLTLSRAVAVGDRIDDISAAVREAAGRADLVVTSGGLGPTTDDLTAEGVAHAAGCGLRVDEEAWERIQALFAARGLPLSPNNRRQAEVPETATTFANGAGVAPGFSTRVGGAEVVSFPGVPSEYRWLLENALLPRLAERLGRKERHLARRTLRTLGIGESAVGHALEGFERAHPEIRVQYRTSFPENLVRLLIEGDGVEATEALADALALEVRGLIGGAVYGLGERGLGELVLAALGARGATLATAESCTGGLIGKLITDVPGSSASYLGGVISYANDVKVAFLDVDPEVLRAKGAVSEEVAAQMAEGARKRLGATYGLSTTGVAGPGGGSDEKPVGTVWFGLSGPEGTFTKRRLLPFPARHQIRELAGAVSLRWLLSHLEEQGEGPEGPLSA